MRIVTVVGARPQFIKVAPVNAVLAKESTIESILVHTGQHFDAEMSSVFFEELNIPEPDINLDINSGSHGQMTGRMIEALEEAFVDTAPDWVLVYGDTNSTVAAAMAASKLPHLRLAHVEAGLRSFNRRMPEEVNRVVTDHLSHLCFTPTTTADENLRREGIAGDAVVHAGDVMFDAVRRFGAVAAERSTVLDEWGLSGHDYVLATVHRAENTDDRRRLSAVLGGLDALTDEMRVVLPLHPRTVKAAESMGLTTGRITVLPPVGYLDMLALEAGARMVVTDSGGVQKEAFFQGRPCVTLRTETEWTELVELGWNRLLPPMDVMTVATELHAALGAGPGRPAAPYGDGHAATRIVDALIDA